MWWGRLGQADHGLLVIGELIMIKYTVHLWHNTGAGIKYGPSDIISTNSEVDGMMAQQHRPRETTEQLIVRAIAASESPMTRTQIARVIKRKKTPHLISIIDDMVEAGTLERQVTVFHNGVQGYVYSLLHTDADQSQL